MLAKAGPNGDDPIATSFFRVKKELQRTFSVLDFSYICSVSSS